MTDYSAKFLNNSQFKTAAQYRVFGQKEEILGKLFVSLYDAPEIKEGQPLVYASVGNGNHIIDADEFKDTEQDYEEKLKKIKQYCKENGIDLSDTDLPSYDCFSKLCKNPLSEKALVSFLKPHKSVDEEICLGDMPYTISKESVKDKSEKRTYQDGTVVNIEFENGFHKSIRIENENQVIQKTFDDTRNLSKSETKDKQTNISEHRFYTLGKLSLYKKVDNNEKKVLELERYNERGARLISENQQLAKELIKDLANKNFLGITSVRSSFAENLEKIDEKNILEVCNDYQKRTGRILIQDIEKAAFSINGISDIFGNNKSQAIIADLKQKYIKAFETSEIEDLQSFLKNTNLKIDTDKMAFDEAKAYWKKETGRSSFEFDFTNSNLAPEEQVKIKKMIKTKADEYIAKFDYTKQTLENQQIINDYYQSDNVYNLSFNGYESVDINNLTTNKQRTLDIQRLIQKMSEIDKSKFISTVQSYPAEALDDMAVEFDYVGGQSGNELELKESKAAAFYSMNDKHTVFDAGLPETNIHEMGHSIDFTFSKGFNSNMSKLGTFFKTFNEELQEYVKTNKQCTGTGENKETGIGESNYCTRNEKEMFAECYQLLITGHCDSEKTILQYFPRTLEEAKKLLIEIRKLPDEVRHKKQD